MNPHTGRLDNAGPITGAVLDQIRDFILYGNIVVTDPDTGIRYSLGAIIDTETGLPTLKLTQLASISAGDNRLDHFVLDQDKLQ